MSNSVDQLQERNIEIEKTIEGLNTACAGCKK